MISVAASFACGCPSVLEQHMQQAREVGVDSQELDALIGIARAVRLQAAMKMDDAAKSVIFDMIPLLSVGADGCGEDCG